MHYPPAPKITIVVIIIIILMIIIMIRYNIIFYIRIL